MATIQTVWFWLIIGLTAVYAVLDGADLGAGILYPFARGEAAKKKVIAAIVPFWDASEVWLLTAAGALFAAFPVVYAEVFSRLYLPVMFAIFALIFRAVSIEFIDKSENSAWKFVFGAMFFIGSAVPPVIFGMAAGFLLCGRLIDPFSFLSGLLVLSAFAMQGAAFLPEEISSSWRANVWTIYIIVFVLLVGFGVAYRPHVFNVFSNIPVFWLLFALVFIFMMITRLKGEFFYSSISIIILMLIFGSMAYFRISPAFLHIASSEATLKTLLVITLIGMPIVVAYTVWFRKAVR